MKRRKFIQSSLTLSTSAFIVPEFNILKNRKEEVIGHGDFRYRVDKLWGVQDPSNIPVKDCHEMVQDSEGRLILLTNETKNNVIFYDRSGKVIKTWGNEFVGAHGLTLSEEGGEEFLYITDPERHQVFKTTRDGKILMTIDYPAETGKYEKADQYKPTEIAVAPNGDFFVADGYGLDYIIKYNQKGQIENIFGGKGDKDRNLKNAHGVCLDTRDASNPTLLVTSRATQEFKKFSLDGKHLKTVKLANCWVCRPVIHGEELYFAVIVSETWSSYDGFVVVLDKNDQVIAAPGASEPTYTGNKLNTLTYDGETFYNPHDVCVDNEKNLYIPQWNSGKTYPVKLERI